MKFTGILAASLLAFVPTTLAVTLAYDTVYDNKAGSLSTVACSDGTHGMLTRGFTTFGSLPQFPHIGAAAAVEAYNSVNCGTCWKVTWVNGQGVSKSINVLAIDHAGAGFNIALSAMNELTGGQAVQLGRIDVTSTQVAASVCGL